MWVVAIERKKGDRFFKYLEGDRLSLVHECDRVLYATANSVRVRSRSCCRVAIAFFSLAWRFHFTSAIA
jgi:hypothetical protein